MVKTEYRCRIEQVLRGEDLLPQVAGFIPGNGGKNPVAKAQ